MTFDPSYGMQIEFSQFGDVDYFEIYRSNTTMVGLSYAQLPPPLVTNYPKMYFVDNTVIEGNVYYYVVVAVLGSEQKISAEVRYKASSFTQNITIAYHRPTTKPTYVVEYREGRQIKNIAAFSSWFVFGSKIQNNVINSPKYFEVTVNETNTVYGDGIGIGVALSNFNNFSSRHGRSGAYQYISNGQIGMNNGYTQYGSGYYNVSGTSVIGCLLKNVNGNTEIEFFKDGVSQGIATTVGGTPNFIILIHLYGENQFLPFDISFEESVIATLPPGTQPWS